MNLIKKIKNYFTPSKIKELEEKIAQIQKNQIKDVLHPIKFEFKGIAEEKLITGKPGEIFTDNKTYLKFACRDGLISVFELQLEGKKRMKVDEFLRGVRQ